MKKLFTLILIAFASFASAQTTCSVCTKPTVTAVIIDGNDLGIGWNNDWFWGYGCSKGISVLINGIEYLPNPNMVHGNAVSSVMFPNIVSSLGGSICVVVRNYCTDPFYSDPTNYVDSDPTCVTTPQPVSATPCKIGSKYVVTNGFQTVQVNKLRCQKLVTQGWTSSCNCQ